MKKALSLISFLVAMGGAATASTLSLNVAVDTSFNLQSTLLGTGYTLTGGWYDTNLPLTFESISANFVSAGSISFPYGGNAAYNGFAAGTTGFFNADTTGLASKNVFWFVSGPGGYALLRDNSVTFKAESAIPNTNTSELNAATFASFSLLAVAPGSSATSVGLIPTAPVPEPSAALLGAIGALGLLRRRRN